MSSHEQREQLAFAVEDLPLDVFELADDDRVVVESLTAGHGMRPMLGSNLCHGGASSLCSCANCDTDPNA